MNIFRRLKLVGRKHQYLTLEAMIDSVLKYVNSMSYCHDANLSDKQRDELDLAAREIALQFALLRLLESIPSARLTPRVFSVGGKWTLRLDADC